MISRMWETLRAWHHDPRRRLDFVGDWLTLPVASLRRRHNRRTTFIGITGSGGKTTTKDLVHRLLSSRFEGTTSAESWNRSSEVARVLFSTRPNHGYCVQELGAFGPGTLDSLLRAYRPGIGVVTSVAREHYSSFRSLEAVAREKVRLVRALPAEGVAVLNFDDEHVRRMASSSSARVISFGQGEGVDVRALAADSRWPEGLRLRVEHDRRYVEVDTSLLGTHWVTAVLASLATGIAMGVSLEDGAEALRGVEPSPLRLSVDGTADGVTFLRDDWNGATWTIPAALEVLASSVAERRILVLGQLSDDPKNPRRLIPGIVRDALASADMVLLVGRWAKYGLRAKESEADSRVRAFDSVRDLNSYLADALRTGDVVLLKAVGWVDHLERLVMDRIDPVRCWRERCGRQYFCQDCRLRTRDQGA